jgi:hypothetical protein
LDNPVLWREVKESSSPLSALSKDIAFTIDQGYGEAQDQMDDLGVQVRGIPQLHLIIKAISVV